jgi:hypothetical protein
MNARSFVLASLFALSVPAMGCAAEVQTAPPPPVPAEEAEVTVETEPPPPPPAQVEVVPASPGVDWYWTPGYHRWWNGRYVWVTGRYARRPYTAAVWVTPHWEVRGRSHVWVGGRWR